MSRPPRHALQQREQLDLFRALPGEDMAPRDAQDLMAYPFFSLAKSRRTAPIDFRSGNITIRVEGTQEHGIATIWDADILIWAASQIVEARMRASSRPGGCRLRPTRSCASSGAASRCATTSVSRPRWIGCNRPQWPRPSAKPREGACTAFVDQRMEGTGRCQRHAAGHRADPAGLVLCGRAGRRPGADHRPDVFPTHGRHRALAVPPGAQAWRPAGIRLAVRLPASAPQVGQQHAVFGFRLRLAGAGRPAITAGIRAGHRADSEDDMELLTFRPVPQTARDNSGQAVDGVVLSGVRGVVLSGVRLSCYQEYENAGKPVTARVCDPSNITNLNSLTISRSSIAVDNCRRPKTASKNCKTPRSTRQNSPVFQAGGPRHDRRLAQPDQPARHAPTVIGRASTASLGRTAVASAARVRQRIVFADSVAAGRLARRQPPIAQRRRKSPRWSMSCCGGRHERQQQPTQQQTPGQAGRHRRASARQSTR